MNVLAQALLNLAFSITPRKDRVWLEDMRYEAAFIEKPLPWSFSALGLALRWRLAHILATPSQMAFASVAMAAIATILILPNMLQPKTQTAPASTTALPSPITPTPEAATENYIDPSVSRSAEAQAVPEEAAAEFSEPVLPTLPNPATEAELPEAIPPTVPLANEDNLADSGETNTVVLGAVPAPTDGESDEESLAQATSQDSTAQEPLEVIPEAVAADTPEASVNAPLSDQVDIEAIIDAAVGQQKDESKALEVNATKISLKITKEVTLEIYQGTSESDELLFSGTTQSATLAYDLPIFIKADEGSAIELYLSKDSRITLDDGKIEKVIQTTP